MIDTNDQRMDEITRFDERRFGKGTGDGFHQGSKEREGEEEEGGEENG